MRVLICGNCSWQDEDAVYDIVLRYKEVCEDTESPLCIISGMAVGADMHAWEAADKLDVFCDEYPWNRWGKRKNAYIVYPDKPDKMRNQWMLDSGVDVCHAFAYDLSHPSGTMDMVNRCFRRGNIPIFWHDEDGVVRKVDRIMSSAVNINDLKGVAS